MKAEVELKLELQPDQAGALIEALELGPPQVVKLRAIYFDTPDRRLAKCGVSLRIRQEGRRRIQTVKTGNGGGLPLDRQEWERPIRGLVPILESDNPAVEALGEEGDALCPQSETAVTRSLWNVATGAAQIEIALDRGEARAGDAASPISELELELKDGSVAELFRLARRIGRLTPVRIGVLTKAERGQRLAATAAESDKAGTVPLTLGMSAGEAFRAVAHGCIRQYRLNEDRLREGDNKAALHQARVAIRRLRSAITAFRPVVGGARAQQLNGDLRWLAGQLGAARNIDVLLPRLHDRNAVARLGSARGSAYARARRAMDSALARELMLDLVEWLSVGSWIGRRRGRGQREAAARDYAARAIGKLHGRLIAESAAIAGPDDEARHDARKTAKKLRYSAESFALLFNGPGERKARIRYLAALEKLQDELGDLNDLAMLPETLGTLGLTARQIDDAVGPTTDRRTILLLQASDAMGALGEAKHFWA